MSIRPRAQDDPGSLIIVSHDPHHLVAGVENIPATDAHVYSVALDEGYGGKYALMRMTRQQLIELRDSINTELQEYAR